MCKEEKEGSDYAEDLEVRVAKEWEDRGEWEVSSLSGISI